MTDQSFMIFELKEKVRHFNGRQSFNNLASLELEPIVKVLDSKENIQITGYLILNGEFLKQTEDWKEQFEQSDGIHYDSFFTEADEEEIETFQFQIPVSFQIEPDRIIDISQVFITVDDFDYIPLSDEEMELTAKIKLAGVHPAPAQDNPVNLGNEALQESDDELSYYNKSYLLNYPVGGKESIEQAETQKEDKSDTERIHPTKFDFVEWQEKIGKVEAHNIEEDEEFQSENTVEAQTETGNQPEEVNQVAEKETTQAQPEEDSQVAEQEVIQTQPQEDEQVEMQIIEQEDFNQIAENESINDSEQDSKLKMKIGIKGKKIEAKPEETTFNSIYSLLKRDKTKDASKEALQETRQVEEKDISIDSKETVELDENLRKNNIVEDQSNEQESIIVEQKEPVDRKTDTKTKDLLFSLVKENEDNKYKLKIYLVQKEDTLESIAEKYNISTDNIIENNSIESTEVYEGQILYLPRRG